MTDGWIKLHRKIFDNPIWQNEKALKIWIWCLLKANHKQNHILFSRQQIPIKKGQFIFGRKKASQQLKIPETTIYFWINYLKVNSYIDIKSTNKYSIITILNWNEYQTIDSKVDNKRTTAMPFNQVAEHQIKALTQAKQGNLYHKIADSPVSWGMNTKMRFTAKKPFDCMNIYKAEAYIVIVYYKPRQKKEFIFIDIDIFIK